MPLSLGLAIAGQGKPREYAELYRAKQKGKEDAATKRAAADQKEIDEYMQYARKKVGDAKLLPVDEQRVRQAHAQFVRSAMQQIESGQMSYGQIDDAMQQLQQTVNAGNSNWTLYEKLRSDPKGPQSQGISNKGIEIMGSESDPDKFNQRLQEEAFGEASYDPNSKRLTLNQFTYTPVDQQVQNYMKANQAALFNQENKGMSKRYNGTDVEYFGVNPETLDGFLSQMTGAPDNYRSARQDFYNSTGAKRMQAGSPEEMNAVKGFLTDVYKNSAEGMYKREKFRDKSQMNFYNNNYNGSQLENPGGFSKDIEENELYPGLGQVNGRSLSYRGYGAYGLKQATSVASLPVGTRNLADGKEVASTFKSAGGTFKSGTIRIVPVLSKPTKIMVDDATKPNGDGTFKKKEVLLTEGAIVPTQLMREAFNSGDVEFRPMIFGQLIPTGQKDDSAVDVAMPLTSTLNQQYQNQDKVGKKDLEDELSRLNNHLQNIKKKSVAYRKEISEKHDKNGDIFSWVAVPDVVQLRREGNNTPAPPAPAPANGGGGSAQDRWKKSKR